MNDHNDDSPDIEREMRVFAVLRGLTDSALIESARKVSGAGGPLNALISELLDRFERHIRRNQVELERLCGELDGLRTFKRGVDEALNSGDGIYRP